VRAPRCLAECENAVREIAQLAAKIDAEGKHTGRMIPFPDLLIGVTALYFNYAVGTRNLRHFQMISGMNVIPGLTAFG
jgi:predicted nucleic acid-binding protein